MATQQVLFGDRHDKLEEAEKEVRRIQRGLPFLLDEDDDDIRTALDDMQSELAYVAAKVGQVRAELRGLLTNVGDVAACKGCGAEVFFVKHKATGNRGIYNPDGSTHFATCPKANSFRKRG